MMEERPTIKDVPVKYRIRAVGTYNAGISRCIKCEAPIGLLHKKFTLIGFAQFNEGLMQIHECPKCFKKQRYHVRTIGALTTLTLLLDLKNEYGTEGLE